MDCPREDNCRNYPDRCLFCDDFSQHKPKKVVKGLKSSPSSKKKGMKFEDKVVNISNEYMARRQPGSGSIPGFDGDIDFFITLLECKEREQEVGGRKTITIYKEWLDKIEKEAGDNGKLPALPFRFKSFPEDIYFIMKYEILLELLYKVKHLQSKVDKLKQ